MYSRTEPTMVLADVADALEAKVERTVASGSAIRVNHDERMITISGDIAVPLTKRGIAALGDHVSIPSSFLNRLGENHPDLQEQVLHQLLADVDEVAIVHDSEGIEDAGEPTKEAVDPRKMVNAVMDVVSADAPVYAFWRNTKEFRLDTIVPEGFSRGTGGDKGNKREKRVGDITRGGVRCGVDFKNRGTGIAPWAQPYVVRLRCLNGMEIPDPSLSIDARGASVDEVLEAFGRICESAFSQIEARIAQFYDLRNQKVDNPEKTILRIAKEHGIADRFLVDIQSRASSDDVPDDPTMFDIVNLVTNEALNESIVNKAITRRNLERIGGTLVVEHAARCAHCLSKL